MLIEFMFRQRNSRPLQTFLTPTTEKEVCIFVQFCNLYAKFVHHFSDLTAPFTGLLQNPHPHKVTRTLSFEEAFETLMLRPISEPCVILPEVSFDAMLTVGTSASTMGLHQSCRKTNEED
jgi:hypothetical protein